MHISDVQLFLVMDNRKQIGSIVMRNFEWTSNTNTVAALCSAAQSCLTLCDPVDCSLPGSFLNGISQKEHWSGLPFPPPGELLHAGNEPTLPALAGESFTCWVTWEVQYKHSIQYSFITEYQPRQQELTAWSRHLSFVRFFSISWWNCFVMMSKELNFKSYTSP